MSMVTKLGRMITYLGGLPPTKTHDPGGFARSREKLISLYLQHSSVYGYQILTIHTNFKWLLPIKLLNLLVPWFSWIT